MRVYWIALICVICVDWNRQATVAASPLNQSTVVGADRSTSVKSDSGEFHFFPAWLVEIGEVGLFILDYVWHHQIVEEVKEVGVLVEEVDAKLDALLALSPAAAQRLQLKRAFDAHFQQRAFTQHPSKRILSSTKKGRRKQLEREEEYSKPLKQLSLVLRMMVSGLVNWVAPYIG